VCEKEERGRVQRKKKRSQTNPIREARLQAEVCVRGGGGGGGGGLCKARSNLEVGVDGWVFKE
jgi:hypothetical protein